MALVTFRREYAAPSRRTAQGEIMPLWLEHLLEDPGLGLRLVAGGGGLRARGPIRWVHSSEIPDPTPWLEGGEVLLTTGMAVLSSAELQRKLIAGLDARGCAAVGFGVGICVDDVPAAMVEEAEARDMPLFTVPYEVPFIAVTKRISRHIFDEHYATLRGAVDLHRQVLAAVLSGTGLEAVLHTVGRALPDHRCVLVDYYGELLAVAGGAGSGDAGRSGGGGSAGARASGGGGSAGARASGGGGSGGGDGGISAEAAAAWAALGPRLRTADRVEILVGGRPSIGAAVRLGDQVEAYLLMLGDREPHEHERLLLEQALTGVSLELARGQSVREAHRLRVDDLIAEAMAGRMSSQAMADRFARLGVDVAGGYTVLCLARPQSTSGSVRRRRLTGVVEDALVTVGPPVLGRSGDHLFAIVPADDASRDIAERVIAAVRARGWPDAVVGRSRTRSDSDGLGVSLREAQVAAGTADPSGTGVHDVTTLGLHGLLAGIDDAIGAEAFIEHTIGAVLAHDLAEGADLADTLRAYQRHGCRPGPAAEELGIHRHTLTYRLDRIRTLTGRDPRGGTHLLAFGLALELHARRRPASR